MQTLTITGLDDIRVYEMYEKDGKLGARKSEERKLEDNPDNSPLNRESLTCFDYDYKSKVAKIGFYRSTDTRCLYLWILKNS
jgi:hypothetical protein